MKSPEQNRLALAAYSDALYIAAWKHFAANLPRGEFARLEDVTAISGGVPLPDFNMVVPDLPAADEPELRQRVERGSDWMIPKNLPWTLVLNVTLLPEGLREKFSGFVDSDAEQHGGPLFEMRELPVSRFSRVKHEQGMIAEVQIERADIPAGLTFRRVEDSGTRREIVEVNFLAYGDTAPPHLHGLDDPRIWNEQSVAIVGYLGGEPVTSSAVFLLEDCFYVGWVATVEKHKRRGFADAVMRESLAAATEIHGWKRSVLHASAAGAPVYRRMGYRAVAAYALYATD